jgi:hypothetical protein
MFTYRSRPKGNYIQEATWEELYILTESWKNTLEFNALEIAFLESLMEAYFVKLLIQENFDVLRELQRDLLEAKKQCENIQKKIQIHSDYIIDIIDEPYNYKGTTFRYTHNRFEDEVSGFKETLKGLMYSVFKMVKNVLESEKPKFIWKFN